MSNSLNIAEKLAIHELLARASYGLDERDVALLADCFSEDAVMTLRVAGGDVIGPFEGRDGIMKLMTDSMEQQTDKRRHVISNIFFESEGDGRATLISNLTLFATANGEIHVLSAGVYHDEVIKTGGHWRLHRRHLELDKSY
jgi:ketosteroid isomerase-like protein